MRTGYNHNFGKKMTQICKQQRADHCFILCATDEATAITITERLIDEQHLSQF